MAEKRKDSKGRKLETGEYYDSKNKRYMFRKMVDGERITLIDVNLDNLRKQKHDLFYRIDRGNKLNNKNAKMTLNAYFDFWFETFARSGRKATTCTNYKSYYNTYVKNAIGKKLITKITKVDCQRLINEMMESGKKHSTMANLKSCLNVIFESAIDDDILLKNPAKNIQIMRTESKKRTAIGQDQIDRFMEYVKNNAQYSYSYPEFIVLFNLGVRIGEMAALTWEDVDFENNTINIDKTVNRYRKTDYGFTMAVASPKSKASIRKVMMNSVVRAELLKLRMKNNTATVSLPYVDDSGRIKGYKSGFLFVNSAGNVWNEPSFRRLITRIIEHYNQEADKNNTERLDDFCPHMARHTYATYAYFAGADIKMVSEIIGHASTAVTLDTYTHLLEEKRREQERIMQSVKIS